MQVASSFPHKHLIALSEAEGAGCIGERGAAIAASTSVAVENSLESFAEAQRHRHSPVQAARAIRGNALHRIGKKDCIMRLKVLSAVPVSQAPRNGELVEPGTRNLP
jgi:hypothetical protein